MNYGTYRDTSQRKRITNLRSSFCTRHQCSTYLQSVRSNNVTFFTISVEKQSDTSRSVWIILDTLYYSWNTIFLSFEVDQTILLLMATADRKSVVVGKECRSRWSPYH